MGVDKDHLGGTLRDRIAILAPPRPEDSNEMGEPIEQWSVIARTWANVQTLSGRELAYAQQMAAEVTHLVTIRWRPGVDRLQVVEFGAARLNIDAAIDPDSLRVQLKLYCREER